MSNENPFNITREEFLELAATKLADQYAQEESLSTAVDKMLRAQVDKVAGLSLQKRCDDFLSAEMQKLADRVIVPVDLWGERVGKPTTLRDALAVRATAYWEEKVDENGKPSSYSGQPRHHYLFKQFAGEIFAAAIKQNVVDVLGALKDAVRADAVASVDKALSQLLNVKSIREQKEKS